MNEKKDLVEENEIVTQLNNRSSNGMKGDVFYYARKKLYLKIWWATASCIVCHISDYSVGVEYLKLSQKNNFSVYFTCVSLSTSVTKIGEDRIFISTQ